MTFDINPIARFSNLDNSSFISLPLESFSAQLACSPSSSYIFLSIARA